MSGSALLAHGARVMGMMVASHITHIPPYNVLQHHALTGQFVSGSALLAGPHGARVMGMMVAYVFVMLGGTSLILVLVEVSP